MTINKTMLPYAATEYIAKRFRKEFLFELKDRRQVEGRWQYEVEVSQDGYIHTLYFSDQGALLKEVADPAFPGDEHDGPTPEEVAE